MKFPLRKNKGFTISEILISLAILTVIYLAVTAFQRDVWVYHMDLSNTLLAQQEAKLGLKGMIKELRTASTGSTGSYPLTVAATSSITFYSDINADGLKDEVRYYLATSTLRKRVIKPTGNPLSYSLSNAVYSEVVHNIANSTSTAIFSYYPSTYAGTTSPLTGAFDITQVRLIKITLTIEKDPNKVPVPMTITSQVSIRNLKDNL